MTRAVLLCLADQRLPAGRHVHSGGVEQAVGDGLVHDVETLRAFLERRLDTVGLVAAGLAAAVGGEPARLDAEVDARMPSPAQREASRAQGRALLRAARTLWPGPGWASLGHRPHHPLVIGRCAAAASLSASDAAEVAAYLSVTGPATAAQRLLALDPLAVAAVTVRLGPAIDAVAGVAVAALAAGTDLPNDCDPLLDLLAERHAARGERLFAS